MLSTRLLIIIVVVLVILAIVSMVIGAHEHSSTSGDTASPTDSSWKPAWMMAWMGMVKPTSHFDLTRITLDKGVMTKGSIDLLAKNSVTLTIKADTSASNPQQLSLTLANHLNTDLDPTQLVSIDYQVTGGDPPAHIKTPVQTTFPVPPSATASSPAVAKTGVKTASSTAIPSSSGQSSPWQVTFAIYPSRGGTITLTSKTSQKLTVVAQ